jgi:DNA repair photolyase
MAENRDVVDAERRRGRGARSNRVGRYETEIREVFDDGWEGAAGLEPFRTEVRLEQAKSIIATNDSPDISFDQSINPYRGCEHGCIYCFARPTHAYLGHSPGIDFETILYAKTNAADLLTKALANKRYVPKVIALGAVTDPYQPIERTHRITREILEVLDAASHPVGIVTKSALIVRDLDILTEMAKLGLVSVGMSVTSMDHILSRKMEPRASTPEKRLEAVRLLAAAGVPTGIMAAPMIPAINDMEMERILDAGRAQGAQWAGMVLLRLPGEVREIFREWMLRHYPDRVKHVMSLVRDTRGGKDYNAAWGDRMRGEGAYATLMQQRFAKAKERFGLDSKLPALRTDLFEPPVADDNQLSLF